MKPNGTAGARRTLGLTQEQVAQRLGMSLTSYGTARDTSEHTYFAPEPFVPDDTLAMTYEGNGLFARIIDTPSEEAVKLNSRKNGSAIEESVSEERLMMQSILCEKNCMKPMEQNGKRWQRTRSS